MKLDSSCVVHVCLYYTVCTPALMARLRTDSRPQFRYWVYGVYSIIRLIGVNRSSGGVAPAARAQRHAAVDLGFGNDFIDRGTLYSDYLPFAL